MRGDGAGARAVHQAMAGLMGQTGDAGRRWSMAYQEAALAAAAGDLDEAESRTAEALEIGTGVAPSRALSAASGQLFALRWQQGRLEELRGPVDHLIAQQPEIAAWRAAGALVHAAGAPERACALFDDVAADGFAVLPRDFTWLAAVLVLGAAAVVLGDGERGSVVRSQLEPYADLVCWQGTCTYGPVAEVLADLAGLGGQPEVAQGHAATAERLRRSLAGAAPRRAGGPAAPAG